MYVCTVVVMSECREVLQVMLNVVAEHGRAFGMISGGEKNVLVVDGDAAGEGRVWRLRGISLSQTN